MFQPGRTQQPVMQEGMTDPRLNETVTHVSELDMDAVIEAVHGWARGTGLALGFVISMLMMILFPPFMILILISFGCVYYSQKRTMVSQAEQSQVYLTDYTFVYVDAAVTLEYHAITIPLENIVTVMAEDSTLTVNIKPTAPEVTRTVMANTGRPNDYTTYATRSISAKYIKNASNLASAIERHIKN